MRFKIISQGKQYRTGVLEVGDKTMSTPACMVYTRVGAVPHVVDQVLKTLDCIPPAVQLSLATLTEQPGVEVIRAFGQGIAKFLGLEKQLVYLSVQDPAEIPPSKYNEDKNVSIWSPGGRKKLDVGQFLELVEVYRPHICECLCDTLPLGGQTAKRIRRSVDRTVKFLDECVKAKQENKNLHHLSLLGAVEGSDSEQERKRSARETAKRPVDGFVLEGFSSHEEGDGWLSILEKTTAELPKDKVRIIHGVGSPDEVLMAVECGVDVFDSSFPYQVTERGCALSWQWGSKRLKLDHCHEGEAGGARGPGTQKVGDTGGDQEKRGPLPPGTPAERKSSESGNTKTEETLPTEFEIDLKDTRYKEDLSPVVSGCACYCCTQHTRAYVHHLLVTKEMLASVLLMLHNMFQYFNFFQDLRQALQENRFDEFKRDFLRTG